MPIKVVASSFTYRFIIIYRPPSSSNYGQPNKNFLEELDSLLADVILVKGKLVIIGDFNLHLDVADDADTITFHDMLHGYGLQQHVKGSTHKKGHTLDVVITRLDESPINQVTISQPLLSDHKAITFALDTQRPPLPQKTIVYRQLKKINMDKFKEDIKQNTHLNGEALKEETDPAKCVQVFSDAAIDLLNKHAPEKKKKITIRPKVKWYTTSVDEAHREKRRWERKWRATNLTIHKELYINAKEKLTEIIKAAKVDYFSNQISEPSNCQKALFKCMDELFHRSRSSALPDIDDSAELAEMMASFFENKVRKICDELEAAKLLVDDGPVVNTKQLQITKLAAFPPIAAEKLRKIIIDAPTKSCQLDPLPTALMKECIDLLLPTLLKIINTSLTSSTVPAPFKKAIITPLLKKPGLDKNAEKSYRPVSNLPFLSKILEKVLSKSLNADRSANDLHVQLQLAYHKHHSTETALLKVQNDVLLALD